MTEENTAVALKPRARKPSKATTIKQAAEERVALGMTRPTLSFVQDINARLKTAAEEEMGEIEKIWASMHARYIELRTVVHSIDASNAIIDGQPVPLDPRLREPGGTVDNADLLAALAQLKQGDQP